MRIASEAAGEIAHDHVAVAVSDEEHGVFRKHALQEASSPGVAKICASEVPVCNHEVAWFLP